MKFEKNFSNLEFFDFRFKLLAKFATLIDTWQNIQNSKKGMIINEYTNNWRKRNASNSNN